MWLIPLCLGSIFKYKKNIQKKTNKEQKENPPIVCQWKIWVNPLRVSCHCFFSQFVCPLPPTSHQEDGDEEISFGFFVQVLVSILPFERLIFGNFVHSYLLNVSYLAISGLVRLQLCNCKTIPRTQIGLSCMWQARAGKNATKFWRKNTKNESQNHPAHSNLAGMSLAGSGVGKNVQQLVTNTAGNKTELIGNEPM